MIVFRNLADWTTWDQRWRIPAWNVYPLQSRRQSNPISYGSNTKTGTSRVPIREVREVMKPSSVSARHTGSMLLFLLFLRIFPYSYLSWWMSYYWMVPWAFNICKRTAVYLYRKGQTLQGAVETSSSWHYSCYLSLLHCCLHKSIYQSLISNPDSCTKSPDLEPTFSNANETN